VITKLSIDAEHLVISEPYARDIPHKSIADLSEKKNILTMEERTCFPVFLQV
jgi:hypothetical protein